MSFLMSRFVVLPIVLSTVFAVLFFPAIVGRHGVLKSLYFTQLGIGVIWGAYFLWGWVINGIVEDEIKKRMAFKEHNRQE